MKSTKVRSVSRSRHRPVSSLRPDDFKAHPIWRFVTDDDPDETWVLPVNGRRVARLAGKIVCTEVVLADGTRRWAMLSNIEPDNAQLTEHFLSLSLLVTGGWFHLARYHDFDARTRGPRVLAAALRRPVGKVFPIRYDLRQYVRNGASWLEGAVRRTPRHRLTRAQIIALAVRTPLIKGYAV
jgi:hypothetical protein